MNIIHYVASNFGPFFLLLGLLIFIHELGHFLVAKYFGVRVETFSLGFGRKILKYKKGDTTYALSLIPLGGYVKMYGDDPNAEIPAAERQHAFLCKPVSQRIAVVLAGPLMNLFLAIFLFVVIAGVGEELPAPVVGDIATDSKAFESGFRPGDKIVSIGGEKTPSWVHVKKAIEAIPGQAREVVVERTGESNPLKFDVAVTYGENDNIFSRERQVGQIQGLTPESRSLLVGVSDPNSPAAQAGLKTLDLIVGVNDKKIAVFRELEPALAAAAASGKIELQVRDLETEKQVDKTRTLTVAVPQVQKDFAAALGIESAELYIHEVKKDSPAAHAGLQSKDRVLRINGQAVASWSDVLNRVKSFDPESEGLEMTVVREGNERAFKMRPEMTKIMNLKGQEEQRFTVGIQPGFAQVVPETIHYRVTSPVEMVTTGLRETATWTEFVMMSVVRLVSGDVSAKNVGGVITIGRVAAHSFEAGFSTFLKTMAIISINLFLLNLLPVPVLDGGHLVFYAYEGIRGAPLSMRKMELAQQIGLMILMCLMVFALFNDITNLIARWRW